MKKRIITTFLIVFSLTISAQEKANRFFYEITFKPKKDSTRMDRAIASLDITEKGSFYSDYTNEIKDSTNQAALEKAAKTGDIDMIFKSSKKPKFTYSIAKTYPDMKIQFIDIIGLDGKFFGYEEQVKFSWHILPEKKKIGAYNTQKATTEFGGRKWVAWFSSEIPFQDGPYKFHGLPGLIVKIEDYEGNYSWLLSGNKKEDNYTSPIKDIKTISKTKFEIAYADFRKDPLSSVRGQLAGLKSEHLNMQIPGSKGTLGDMMKKIEKETNDIFNSVDNPIELPSKNK